MKKIFYLYILIFLSCDPGWFGLEEELGIYSYHDGMAFAWEVFFGDGDYDTAISYVKSAIEETEDEEYYNSAYTALGWFYLFKSNSFVNIDSDSIVAYRDSSYTRFLYDDDELLAIDEYTTGCFPEFCCSDCFAKDRQLGLLFTEIEQYFLIDDNSNIDIVDLASQLVSFVENNSDYDFMNGKPFGNDGEFLDLTIDDVKVYLAQVHFRVGQFTDSCILLNSLLDFKDCDLDCSIDWDNTNLDDLLDCMNSQVLF